jgi:hypothetical protein
MLLELMSLYSIELVLSRQQQELAAQAELDALATAERIEVYTNSATLYYAEHAHQC